MVLKGYGTISPGNTTFSVTIRFIYARTLNTGPIDDFLATWVVVQS